MKLAKLKKKNSNESKTSRKTFGSLKVKTEPICSIDLKPSDANNYCRVCLKIGCIPLFGSKEADAVNLSESLSVIGSIEVTERDDFPKFLCEPCYNLLNSALLFRCTAQKTDKLLRQDNTKNTVFNGNETTTNLKETISEFDIVNCDETTEKSKTYHCNRCDLDFNTWKLYSIHTKSDEHRNFKVECSICKGLYTTFYIKKHILRHRLDPEQAYICDVCGKSFVLLGAFNRHRAIHGFDLPFKCNLCPYRGRFTESLKMHMRSHTGEKPYPCPQCPARFINKSNLNKHSSIHKTVHDFKCDGCGRGYYRKRDLELHIKVYHSGIREHVCTLCGKAFGYRKQMMKHQLKVHKREKLKSGRTPLYIQAEQSKKVLIENDTMD